MLRSARRSKLGKWMLGPRQDDESQPLLASDPAPSRTPLPFKQVLVLCLCRFGEPIALLLPFPFISAQLQDMGVPPARVGYYAGTIESLFAFCTFLTILFWGRLSDRIGRLPVLISGLLGVASATCLFGFMQSFIGLVIARCLAGSLNGNVVVIKSILGEITDDSNQGQAFAFLPMAWSSGSVLGPMIGGYLANPSKHYPILAERFPNLFGDAAIFKTYPYALPCLVGALFPLVGALVAFFFLEETLTPSVRLGPEPKAVEEIRGRSSYGAHTSSTVPAPIQTDEQDRHGSREPSCATLVDEEADATLKKPSESWYKTLFTSKRVQRALLVYALLALQTVALDAIFVLFCYSPTPLGGLGFSEHSIGISLALGGAFTVSFQLVLFPPLQRRIGTTKLYRLLMSLYPIVFALLPAMSLAAQYDDAAGDDSARRTWVLMVTYLFVKSLANIAYACNMLTITDAAPSRELLGSLNGVAQMLASLCRALGPLAASSLFALSKERRWLGGNLVWYVMVVMACVSAAATWLLVDAPCEWREQGSVVSSGRQETSPAANEEGTVVESGHQRRDSLR